MAGSPSTTGGLRRSARATRPGPPTAISAGAGWCRDSSTSTCMSGDQDEAVLVADFHRRHGTTTTMASLVTGDEAALTRIVTSLAELVDDGLVAGIHLEGPFLAEARCGAHDPGLLREPEPALVERLLQAGHGTIRMMTLAAELPYADDAVRRVVG